MYSCKVIEFNFFGTYEILKKYTFISCKKKKTKKTGKHGCICFLRAESTENPGACFQIQPRILAIFVNIALELKTTMESCSATLTHTAFLVLDFLYDQNFFLKNSFFAQKMPFLDVFNALQKLWKRLHRASFSKNEQRSRFER